MTFTHFLSIFVFIFLAALPGRTTFVLIALSAKLPWKSILTGAGLAFAAQSLISVSLGKALSFLPPSLIQIGAGVLFFYFSWQFWKEATQMESETDAKSISDAKGVFALIFMAEWGDVSQLGIASASAQTPEKAWVLVAAIAALWIITALAIALGQKLGNIFKPQTVQKVASIAFLIFGILLVAAGIR